MPQRFQHTLVSVRDLLITGGPLIVLTLVLLVVAYWLLKPTPPDHMVLATGSQRGAYAEFGTRYARLLAREGIKVELRNTQGSIENLALLRDATSGVDVAFVQGGIEGLGQPNDGSGNDDLESLGSLFYEPVWLFYREESARRLLKEPTLTRLSQLPGWRVNGDTEGSGARAMVNQLLEANAVDPRGLTLLNQPTTPAVVSFLAGDIDAVVFVSAPESLMVQMLLRTPGVRLFDFAQSEAYARRFPSLSPVTLPRGIVDLASDQPSQDVHLVAPTAMMVAREGTHPALVQLLVQAAAQIHGTAGWFRHKGDFPNTRNTSLPIASEAARFYRDGLPLLQRYLPFWLANLIDRMWVVLISIVAVLIPLSRVVPPLYQFRVRSRVFRWYGQLREIETRLHAQPQAAADVARELDALDDKVGRISVPL
ncbi:MAG TPA: TAXI family TRAP transporter solute-binding subunit, partial [Burkholderiaceae bacterium]|nr:TAXI family TRAP transporter solute-binding subunit [Burkholderiaceae bacterium]